MDLIHAPVFECSESFPLMSDRIAMFSNAWNQYFEWSVEIPQIMVAVQTHAVCNKIINVATVAVTN